MQPKVAELSRNKMWNSQVDLSLSRTSAAYVIQVL